MITEQVWCDECQAPEELCVCPEDPDAEPCDRCGEPLGIDFVTLTINESEVKRFIYHLCDVCEAGVKYWLRPLEPEW